jgi:hypothetical protein
MVSMPSYTGNKLERWIKTRSEDEVKVMNFLQEYGIVSDNSVWAKDVSNDSRAMLCMAKNFERFKTYGV